MGVVDRIVDEDAAFLHGGAGLLRGEVAGFIKIDAIKSGFRRHLEPLHNTEFPPAGLTGDHP